MPNLTLGSLFDGSGGFPLGALMNGIAPIWASEIEPFAIRVTTKRIPQMKHYGDISKLNGGEIEPVDIITFGSPCTCMSVAGKRSGLDSGQSALFFEAIRIIKEMRCATNGKYPRFTVFENVPGAFSSGQGNDFRKILEEIVKIKDEAAVVPMPENGRWMSAGEIMGNDYSVAYRTFDAQHWGVAQRRRRIYLVADFTGERAGKVLFEFESLSGYTPQSVGTGQRTAANAQIGTGTAGNGVTVSQSSGFCTEHSAKSRGVGFEEERSPTLRAGVVPGVAIENHPTDGRCKIAPDGKVQTLTSRMGTGGMNVPLIMRNPTAYGICSDASNSMRSDNPHSGIYEADTSRTLDQGGGNPGCNQGGIAVVALQGSMIGRADQNGPQGSGIDEEVSFTLNTVDRHGVAYAMTTGSYAEIHEEKAATLMARDFKDPQVVNQPEYTVRRLTPTECALLQGFPADWCANLGTENPTDADIAFWADVFETHLKIMGTSSKPKSRKQIAKWLRNPHSDSAEYKL